MKRTLTLMLTMAALCCAFTACGNSDKMDSDSDSATEATEKVTEETSVSETEKPSDTDSGNIITKAGEIVDDLVSTGEDIVDDAGSAV